MVNTIIQRGQRLGLKEIVPSKKFKVGVYINNPELVVDFACFGLDSSGKLSDERYMTFFNQPSTPCGGVEIMNTTGNNIVFSMNLEKIPSNIHRLIITAAIDGNGTMSQLRDGYVRFILNDKEATRFDFTGADFASEKALILLEIYRKNDEWRVCATGQGFNGGLDTLVKHFGGVVEPILAESSAAQDKNIISHIDFDGHVYDVHNFNGIVINSNKRSQTIYTESDSRMTNNGHINTRHSSRTTIFDDVIVRNHLGKEHHLRLLNWDYTCGIGNELNFYWINIDNVKVYLMLKNYTTDEILFKEDQVGTTFYGFYTMPTIILAICLPLPMGVIWAGLLNVSEFLGYAFLLMAYPYAIFLHVKKKKMAKELVDRTKLFLLSVI